MWDLLFNTDIHSEGGEQSHTNGGQILLTEDECVRR